MSSLFIFFRRIRFFYKINSPLLDWKKYLLFDFLLPFLEILFFILMMKNIHDDLNFPRYILGNILLITSYNSLYRVGVQILSEKYSGTLGLLLISKTSLNNIFISNMISSMVSSIIRINIYTLILCLIFSVDLTLNIFVNYMIISVVTIFTINSFSYVFSCFILLTTEVNLVINIVSKVLIIFSGVNFDIHRFPFFIRKFSIILPLNRMVFMLNSGFYKDSFSIFLYKNYFFEELILGIIYIIIANILLLLFEKIARRKGEIDFV